MNFNDLKSIIRQLKKSVTCTQCSKKFMNDDIQVLSTFGNEGLFFFNCQTCQNQLFVHISISEQDDQKNLNIQTQNAMNITQNDVLDIHNFLNRFNGDFKKLFSK